MSLYGYTRVSTGEQVEGFSLEIQERRIVGLATANGESVDRIFSDADVSGSVPLSSRPAGGELWRALKPADTVIASKLDRLFRNASDALQTSDILHKRGISLVLLDIGMEPVNQSGAAKMFFAIMAVVAEFERSVIRERVTGGRDAKRASGGHIGGSAPFGFRIEGRGRSAALVALPEMAPALARVAELRAGGLSFQKISYMLQEEFQVSVSHKAVRKTVKRLQAAS